MRLVCRFGFFWGKPEDRDFFLNRRCGGRKHNVDVVGCNGAPPSRRDVGAVLVAMLQRLAPCTTAHSLCFG